MPEQENQAGAEAPEEVNSEGETPQLEHAEEKPSIESIAALSDSDLHELLGHNKDLKDVREGIAAAQALTGKAREYAEGRIDDWFRPKVYTGDFKYLAEDAKRRVAQEKKSAKAALDDDSPCSVI